MRGEYDRRNPYGQPASQLVKQVRHAAQHSRLPLIRQHLNMARDNLDDDFVTTVTFKIDASYLRSLPKLAASVREHYAAQSNGDVPVLDVVLEYSNTTFEFFRWFTAAIGESNAVALAETNTLRRAAVVLSGQVPDEEPDQHSPRR